MREYQKQFASLKAQVSFKPKNQRSALHNAARIIQREFRRWRCRKLFAAIDSGSVKIFKQKHAAMAMNSAAALMQAAIRGTARLAWLGGSVRHGAAH